MRKKLLAGVMALALCSTNMPLQTIFAGEFTSGNLEEVSEETPEIFSDDNQEVIEETEEELSVFSSENVPEFSSEVNIMSATAGETEPIEINMENKSGTYYDSTNNLWIIKASGSYRFNGNGTGNNDDPIIIKNIDTGTVKIYLNNVSINAPDRSALLIEQNVNAQVYIYLQNNNKLSTSNNSAACLQKNNTANLTIDNAPNTTTTGSLTVSKYGLGAGIGGGSKGSGKNITISGGSVNAQVGCTPHQNLDSSGSYDPKSPEVYLYVIPNKKTELVAIDNKVWEPSNHKAVESTNTNLYAWLTGEDHLITVGEETKSYIFNSNLGTFSEGKRDVTSDIFEFNGSEFTYDGNTHSPNITTKNNIKGVGNFSVKYFKENDPTNEITVPKDVGTYTVKITVEEGDFYKESSGYLTSDDWKFAIKLTPTITTYTDEYDGDAHPVINIDQKTIPSDSTIEYSINDGQTWNILNSNNDIPTVRTVTEAENTKIFIRISNSNYVIWTSQEYKAIISRATQTPNFPSPSNTKIPVPWSCKKVGDITTILPEHWIWKDTDKSKELKVEEPISADAVYNGTDKGNYVTETVTYTITRKECEHKNTVGVYYSSPSCTSNGYSGDTYCNDCERTIYYGSTIPAYGHDYDNGVITTEPTAETDGIINDANIRIQKTSENLATGNLILREVSRRKAGMLSMI